MYSNQEFKDMSFDEFVIWATGHIIFGIGSGQVLRGVVWEIMNNFVLNWLPTHGWQKKKI